MTAPEIIFIAGPTGVGKSAAALVLAKKIGGEIVSCDAMQVYREVNIASDKPSAQDRRRVMHHMLDVVSATEEFNAGQYCCLAIAAIDDIRRRGKTPIVVGGSGMYMAVLLDGIFESQAKDESLRQQLRAKDTAALHTQLQQADPQAAAKIHPNDQKRLVRALEVIMLTGRPISQLHKEREGLWGRHPVKIFGLNRPREELYKLVEDRIDRMFEQGLIEEVRALLKLKLSLTASTLIGIPEVAGYLNNEYDLARARYLLKLNSRHYAKRQLTWFRRDERIQWVEGKDLISHCDTQ